VTFDFENAAAQIAEEAERLAKWKAENERRRHNYVPAIFELLKQLAQKNMLENLYKDAVKRKEEKKAEKTKA
jgi:ubiquitin carboxyl-terminal hydrolase L5